ncbi:SurA N-terminal domain-containing protein [Francisella marina]|uniref:Peptidyl-prolyl cis-trans isomerase n=1 Tax=Francisella marina TaxID=2249302 RepID=A0ABX5ZEZ0_9GAMM|nr:SurA N-terminal domain-containing protein [Francisella marina]QEO56703.1 peptidyl-prolyl cis-trans isomerase [Francisella marina]QEO59177.1 peptidyl-prolyl cis-trans isomerase [Francisella marina]
MLQSFNDRLKGPFTWIIIISISFIFVISGMTFFFTNIGSSRSYVAKVGDNEIGLQQFQQYAQNATTEAQKRAVLDQMINQYLVLADAQRHNIAVSKLALQSAIFTNPMFFDKEGKFSADKLKQVVEYIGGMSKLEQILTQNIQATMIPKAIADTTITTDYEKKLLDNIYLVNKKIEYLKISPSDFKSQIKPTQQDLEAYYNAHKNEYINPAKKKINYFIITKDSFISKSDISESDIKSYYDTHKEFFKGYNKDAKTTIAKIIQNRRALEKFNTYSQNIDSISFTELEKNLGNPKVANIVNNDESTISTVANSQFFVNTEKYSSIPVADNEILVYEVNNSQPSTQQKLADVKSEVSKAVIAEKSQRLSLEKSQKLLDDLVSDKKVSVSFKQATIDSNSKSFSKEFNDYVMFNTNNQYHSYQADNGDIYIYKVIKVEPLGNKDTKLPRQVLNTVKEEELNFYLQVVKQEVPVKVNYKNI